MTGLNIILAILVFSLIVLFHEFGHFIVAKKNRVKVLEFSLGMGPRLLAWGKTPEGRKLVFWKSSEYFEEHPEFSENTLYSWKLLPFGGSCMMLGEEQVVEDENAFNKKSVYARMAIIFAGPLFNFILAFIFSAVLIAFMGYSKPVITHVEPGSAAEQAGLKQGDLIREINDKTITLNGDLSAYITFHPLSEKEDVSLVVERDNKKHDITVSPKLTEQPDGSKRAVMGVLHGSRERVDILSTMKYAAYEMKYYVEVTIKSLVGLVTQKVDAGDVAGPIGIVSTMGSSISENQNAAIENQEQGNTDTPGVVFITILSMMNWCVLLSANLGVMNLLPIPALDGGRLLFLIIEWIRRKPLNPKYENAVNVAGFMLLMILMIVILGHDLIKIIF